MNWKYWVGRFAYGTLDWSTCPGKPLSRLPVPFGARTYLDLRRLVPGCQLIVDCGANIGDTAIAFRDQFPERKS